VFRLARSAVSHVVAHVAPPLTLTFLLHLIWNLETSE
jgi:hypothetical protein